MTARRTSPPPRKSSPGHSFAAAAQELNVPPGWVHKAVAAGQIEAVQIGGSRRRILPRELARVRREYFDAE
jgi:hypothetical protein